MKSVLHKNMSSYNHTHKIRFYVAFVVFKLAKIAVCIIISSLHLISRIKLPCYGCVKGEYKNVGQEYLAVCILCICIL